MTCFAVSIVSRASLHSIVELVSVTGVEKHVCTAEWFMNEVKTRKKLSRFAHYHLVYKNFSIRNDALLLDMFPTGSVLEMEEEPPESYKEFLPRPKMDEKKELERKVVELEETLRQMERKMAFLTTELVSLKKWRASVDPQLRDDQSVA